MEKQTKRDDLYKGNERYELRPQEPVRATPFFFTIRDQREEIAKSHSSS